MFTSWIWLKSFVIPPPPQQPHNKIIMYNNQQLVANWWAWHWEGQTLAPCWSSCVTSDSFMSLCQVKPLWRAAITIPRSGHLNWPVINKWTQKGSVWSRMVTWQSYKFDRNEWIYDGDMFELGELGFDFFCLSCSECVLNVCVKCDSINSFISILTGYTGLCAWK